MGTNYYARILPKHERKRELIKAIEEDRFGDIVDTATEMYGKSDDHEVRGIVHLGKRFRGWKFLWNPNVRKVYGGHRDPETNTWVEEITYDYLYPLTRQGISDFVRRDDVMIVSEDFRDDEPCRDPEDDNPTAEQFLAMAFGREQEEGWDYKAYYGDHPEERIFHSYDRDAFWRSQGFETNYGLEFYSDGLRFATSVEFR